MGNITNDILSAKLLEACGCGIDSSIYSFLPILSSNNIKYTHTHNLHTLTTILDSAVEIFTGYKTKVSRQTPYYLYLIENKEAFLKHLDNLRMALNYKEDIQISHNRISASLAAISHIYFNVFFNPTQFFLPYSSITSGRWDFWDRIDYLKLIDAIENKNFIFSFREKMQKSKIWDYKPKAEEFPAIQRRGLIKEGKLNKKYSPECMIKAMIIRMGEMTKPSTNYETIDFSIRTFFRHINVNQYLRVDREIAFCRKLEQEIEQNIEESMNVSV